VKVQADTFLIKVEKTINNRIGNLIVDTDYNKYNHAVQEGVVFALPIKITPQYKYDIPLEVGDNVVFHHFVVQPDHKIPMDMVYRCEYFHIYGVIREGELMAIEDAIFVEPIKENDSELYKGAIRMKMIKGDKTKQGIVFASSKSAQSEGILSGDKVYYGANADYKMKAVDKDLFRMRIRNIFAVERGGEIVCMRGQLLVKNIEIKDTKDLKDIQKSKLKGIVVKKGEDTETAELGDVIIYHNGLGTDIEIDGESYNVVNIKNVDYIL
jgi:co-chaperonin GroES (HSP10)